MEVKAIRPRMEILYPCLETGVNGLSSASFRHEMVTYQLLTLSPSHLPTFAPAPAKVDLVITNGRSLGLLFNIEPWETVDITKSKSAHITQIYVNPSNLLVPKRLCVSYIVNPFWCLTSVLTVLLEIPPSAAFAASLRAAWL